MRLDRASWLSLALLAILGVGFGCQSDESNAPPASPRPAPLPSATSLTIPTPTSIPDPTSSVTSLPVATLTSTPEPTPDATPAMVPDTPSPAPSPLAATPATTSGPTAPTVTVGDVEFEVEIVHTPAERATGLSGRDSLRPMTGMLFVFESGTASAFWMKDMRFPLDFVWIGEECEVVDTTLNVPHPPAPDSPLQTFESVSPAAYTFEVNAGELEALGIQKGDPVRFAGFPEDVVGAKC